MKAAKENIIKKERHKLEEVLPLSFPYSMVIDPCNLCNFQCQFCAIQKSEERQRYKKQFMEMALFEKIINNLSELNNRLKVLRLSGNGEPFLNTEIIKMISYAKEKHVADFIETVTNGSKLNPRFNTELVNSGIDRIRISIEAVTEDGYAEIAAYKINLEEFVANIKDLYYKSGDNCEIYIKTVDAAVDTEEKKRLFYDMFGDICDKIWIDSVIPLWSDYKEINQCFDIQKVGLHGQELKTVKVCPYPFYHIIVNPDGEVTACCADWKRKLVLGNLSSQRFEEIWDGEVLREFWIEMLKGNKNKYEMCAKCVLPMYDCNDNIDDYAEQILLRL